MHTIHDEIADCIHRFASFAPDAGITFCRFLIEADEPLLFHTGLRHMFPAVREMVARVIDPASRRWIAFGHLEADECGSMNEWLAIAPDAPSPELGARNRRRCGSAPILVSLNLEVGGLSSSSSHC